MGKVPWRLSGRANLFDPGMTASPEQGAQRDAIGVTDACGNLVDAGPCRLEEMDGPLHPQGLSVLQRRLPSTA